MAYIPERHKTFELLPRRTAHGGEVIVYFSTNRLETFLRQFHPLDNCLDPYGYDSLDEYLKWLDGLISVYSEWPEALRKLEKYKSEIIDLNNKENWSVCRYVGANIYDFSGLTHGRTYYWPCSSTNPRYTGVIDDEEFSNYLYPSNPELWEVLDDPTGMVTNLFEEWNKKRTNA